MMFSDDISVKIIALGYATQVGVDIFLTSKAKIPAGAGPYISIVETGGMGSEKTHSTRYPRPGVQILVRAREASVARAKAKAMHAALDGLYNVTINGTKYQRIVAVQDVMDQRVDETGRPRFAFNLESMSA
jgi:hypothetical protein